MGVGASAWCAACGVLLGVWQLARGSALSGLPPCFPCMTAVQKATPEPSNTPHITRNQVCINKKRSSARLRSPAACLRDMPLRHHCRCGGWGRIRAAMRAKENGSSIELWHSGVAYTSFAINMEVGYSAARALGTALLTSQHARGSALTAYPRAPPA